MTTGQLVIGAGNKEQAAAWNGDEGDHWAAHPDFYDAAVRRHQVRFMSAACVGTPDRVLDVGCGNGAAALAAAERAADGSVLAVDLSAQMLRVAAQRAASAGVDNVSFLQADAQVHPFDPDSFDLVLSRFGAMFFADQGAAFTNLAHAVRPGGRLVVMSWRAMRENEWIRTFADALAPGAGSTDVTAPSLPPDGQGPFAHADAARTSHLLELAGFSDIAFEAVDEPMYFGRNVDEGYALLRQSLVWMTGDVDDAAREAAFERLQSTLEEHEGPEGVAFGSAAWLITGRR